MRPILDKTRLDIEIYNNRFHSLQFEWDHPKRGSCCYAMNINRDKFSAGGARGAKRPQGLFS